MVRSHFEFRPYNLPDFSAPEERPAPAKMPFYNEGVAGEDGFVPLSPAVQPPAPEAIVPEPEPEPVEPPAPTFSEEELAAACERARMEGIAKGKQEAEAAFDVSLRDQRQSVALLVSDLMSRLDAEAAAIGEVQERQRREVGTLVLLMAKKLAGNALTAQPLGAVEPTIRECLQLLQGEAKLKLVVAPQVVEPLRELLVEIQRDGQVVEVVADEKFQIGDCRIQWPGGKAERNQEAIWREVESIITRTLIQE